MSQARNIFFLTPFSLIVNEYLESLRAEKLIYFESRWTVTLKKTSELEFAFNIQLSIVLSSL